MTADLPDFLLARIAEDEAVAQAATVGPWEVRPYWFTSNGRSWATVPDIVDEEIDAEDGVHIARWDPARVLAECKAKRRIVTRYVRARALVGKHPHAATADAALLHVLTELALPYADHPDYRPEWRIADVTS
jgi:hypothetical protein